MASEGEAQTCRGDGDVCPYKDYTLSQRSCKPNIYSQLRSWRFRYTQIYLMNPGGSDQINLTRNLALDSGPAWSPDGTRIAFLSNRELATIQDGWAIPASGGSHIYAMNWDGTAVARLTHEPGAYSAPSWTPDGSRLLFTSESSGQTVLFDIDAISGAIKQTWR